MSPARRGVFIGGTDTGVGKTRVGVALVRALRARGLRVGAMKPVETGVGDEGPADARALREAAGGSDPLDDVCPQRFAMPAAPSVAARAEGRSLDLTAIDAAHARLRERHDFLVVEGAGGLLVPLDTEHCMADLARRFGLPLLLVARAALGTINHTRLTLEAARARGLEIAGLVVCHADGVLSAADAANLAELRERERALWVGEIPPLAPDAEPGPDALDLDAILRT